MAKGPAVVFVARHGARLDAADKTWHLTSPTPYDPPLTYGGWSQAKALGLRIAALLDQRDHDQLEAAKSGANADLEHLEFSKLDASRAAHAEVRRPKKKRKIIIHSSPYLRCIQTSTAVAAGISQYQSPTTPHIKVPEPPVRKEGQRERASIDTSPKTKAMASKVLLTVEPLADPNLEVYARRQRGPEKILLRIDAFLGEWLSPDYYEDITPPPNSTMMVAGAKADLLRRGDYIQQMANTKSSRGFFPGGWMGKSAASSGTQSPAGGASPTLGSLASVSPFRDRSSSQGSSSLQRTKSRENVAALAHAPPKHRSGYLYEAPMPSYSVSPADPIPRGYAAHAREACISVDFQWDSMRPPQEWGDGGEYGDEWSTMHKRFRKGLAGMMNWYREHGTAPPKEQIRGFMFKEPLRLTPAPLKHAPSDPFPTVDGTVEADDEEELVLVLITHGAGCNALLGAISNQPVLVDVGLASLSMAVRCPFPRKPSVSTIHERRLSVADPGMSDTYEMKLLASVDHLKPGVDPSRPQTPSQVRSPVVLPSPSLESRRRFTGSSGANSPLDSPFSIGEPFRSWNSSLGSMRRTMSSGSNKAYMSSNLNPSGTASPASSTGLWSSPKITPTIANNATPTADISPLPNLHNQQKSTSQVPSRANTGIPAVDDTEELANGLSRLNTNEQKEVGDSVAPLRTGTATNSQKKPGNAGSPGLWGAAKPQAKPAQGLWGPPRLDDVYEHGRGPKRRWTVTAREEAG